MKGWTVRAHLSLLLASLETQQLTLAEAALFREAQQCARSGEPARGTMKARRVFRSILLRTRARFP